MAEHTMKMKEKLNMLTKHTWMWINENERKTKHTWMWMNSSEIKWITYRMLTKHT